MKSNDGRRILIADDDPSILTALSATLEADGYEVEVAGDGKAAIDALAARPFDLAILDLAMPQIDGLEVLRELRNRGSAGRFPPVLVLTAYGSITAAVESARHGAIDFLHKPIEPESLRMSVRMALAGSGSPPLPEGNGLRGVRSSWDRA